jgi:hypothetical protein
MGLFLDSPGVAEGESREGKSKDASKLSNLATLTLEYSKKELASYTEFRVAGISKASIPWMKRCSLTFWNATKGAISKERCDVLREHLSARYTDPYAPRKVLNFGTAFLKYLAKTHFDTRYQAFDLFLEMPKGLKARKHVTSRIVTKEDVEHLLHAIKIAFQNGEIDNDHYLNFRAIVLFGAFTGQRPQATIARLSVGQFRKAVSQEKPVLDILPDQDKIRMQHYCPLHPQVVAAIVPLLDGRLDDEPMFKQLSFERWLKQQKVRLIHGNNHFVPGDLRKLCEQMGDILQWDVSNKNYILTHGVSGVDWRFYKSPRPAPVFDIYMKYWRDVSFETRTWRGLPSL